MIVGDDKTILSGILTDKEKAEERAKRGPTVITPAPDAAMPAPDSPDSPAGTRKGMFDDIEAEMSGGKKKEKGQ